MGWKKGLAITGIVLAVILVAAGTAVYTLSRPPTLEPYHDTLDPAVRDQQTWISVALHAAGVEDALVTVRDGTARASYGLPANTTVTPDDWQRIVLGAMAPLAKETTTLVAIQFVDGKPSIGWSVPTEKVLGYADGTVTPAELEAAITKREL